MRLADVQTAMDVASMQMPMGLVAVWALIGVVAAVILVRLRDGDFGMGAGAGLVLIGGFALGVLYAAMDAEWSGCRTSLYMHVDQAVAERQQLRERGRHLQVHGRVVPGSIERRLGTDQYRFRMESREDRPRATLDVRYDGLVPDTFRSGAEIVAKGTLVGDGVLDVEPDGIQAKCRTMDWPLPEPEWRSVGSWP